MVLEMKKTGCNKEFLLFFGTKLWWKKKTGIGLIRCRSSDFWHQKCYSQCHGDFADNDSLQWLSK